VILNPFGWILPKQLQASKVKLTIEKVKQQPILFQPNLPQGSPNLLPVYLPIDFFAHQQTSLALHA
jgi:hypothetical protein